MANTGLTIIPSNCSVVGKHSAIKDCKPKMVVQVRADTNPTERPFGLVLVLDLSHSMSGELDSLKISVKDVFRHINEQASGTWVAVVAFGTIATVLVEPTQILGTEEQMVDIFAKIDALELMGGTNVDHGLHTAVSCACLMAPNCTFCDICVLTDGDANIGETNPEILRTRTVQNFTSLAPSCQFLISAVGFTEGYKSRFLEQLVFPTINRRVFHARNLKTGWLLVLGESIDMSIKNARVVIGDSANTIDHVMFRGTTIQRDAQARFVVEIGVMAHGSVADIILVMRHTASSAPARPEPLSIQASANQMETSAEIHANSIIVPRVQPTPDNELVQSVLSASLCEVMEHGLQTRCTQTADLRATFDEVSRLGKLSNELQLRADDFVVAVQAKKWNEASDILRATQNRRPVTRLDEFSSPTQQHMLGKQIRQQEATKQQSELEEILRSSGGAYPLPSHVIRFNESQGRSVRRWKKSQRHSVIPNTTVQDHHRMAPPQPTQTAVQLQSSPQQVVLDEINKRRASLSQARAPNQTNTNPNCDMLPSAHRRVVSLRSTQVEDRSNAVQDAPVDHQLAGLLARQRAKSEST